MGNRKTAIANLKKGNPKWKKGDPSPNPNGRPNGQKNYATLYRESLIKLAQLNGKEPDEIELEMISKGITLARSGDFRFYKDTLDRLHGTAVNKTELYGKDGGPIEISNKTDDELAKLAGYIKD